MCVWCRTQLLPHVLDQCMPGFVTAILIQSVTSAITTSQVDHHLRLCNPYCNIVYSPLELIASMVCVVCASAHNCACVVRTTLFVYLCVCVSLVVAASVVDGWVSRWSV